MANVDVSDLSNAVMNALQEQYEDIAEGVKDDIVDVAKECVKEIKSNIDKSGINKRTGKYRKSWKVKKMFEDREDIRMRVYSTNYQITHLLEKGHATRNGGRAKAYPHIAPAEQSASEKLQKKIKLRVGK